MHRTRIKICGITRPQDAQLAADLGADFIGVNTFNGPREITPSVVKTIASELPKRVTVVALTEAYGVRGGVISWFDELYESGVRTIQLYLADTLPVNFVPNHQMDWWLVESVDSRNNFRQLRSSVSRLPQFVPAAILLDTAVPTQLGGTGKTFNWHWIAEARAAGELDGLPPIILAGGLNPDNVADAIRIARPYAVDVSSGVEIPGHPGIKDPVKLRDFIQAVHAADAELSNPTPAR
jgi:phosphoribosylanthranilate isomerase